uniref:Gamma-interferon-inducible lysosomal thiol reductase n=1 Tax=Kalanchoe fedtschenkoi TaxID=63787 RepID=A0A7N0TG66_KALFE
MIYFEPPTASLVQLYKYAPGRSRSFINSSHHLCHSSIGSNGRRSKFSSARHTHCSRAFRCCIGQIAAVEVEQRERQPYAVLRDSVPRLSDFIVNHLTHLFEDVEMLSIVGRKLVPYGNAEKSRTGTVICQHGEWECKLNKVEACAINVFPIMNEYFLFIHCVEDLVDKYQNTEWEQCLKELNDPTPTMDCFNGQRGDELISKYGDMTNALHPPHPEVPWATVNDKPIKDCSNYLKYVCEAYKGPDRPAKSSYVSLKSTLRAEGSSSGNPVKVVRLRPCFVALIELY